MTLNFPWPPSDLSPNARVHWGKKAKAFKAYKEACMWTGKAAGWSLHGHYRFKITFCPPDKRKYDVDNLVARGKALVDALAVLTMVDDSEFELTFARGAPVAHGQVTVEVLG